MQYRLSPSYPPSWSFVVGVIELRGADIASMRVGGPRALINIAHSRGMYLRRESEPFLRWRFASGSSPTAEKRKARSGKAGLSLGEARGDSLRFT